MAGDWIKIRPSLLTSPKVNGIARILESDPRVSRNLSTGFNGPMSEVVTRNVMRNVTVSLLVIIWGAANEHTTDGIFKNADLSDIDDMVGVPGFGEAMQAVGWAEFDEENNCVILPNFNEYNTCGKDRSSEKNAERQRRYREKRRNNKGDGDEKSNVTRDVTNNDREEKRREDISNANALDSSCSEPEVSKPPIDHSPIFILIPTNKFNTSGEQHPVTENQIHDWVIAYPAVDVRRVLAQIRSWSTNNPAKRKTVKGMNRFIDSWLAREQNSGGNGHATNQQHRVTGSGASKPSPADLVRAQARQALECVDREAGDPGVHPNGGSVWPQSH